MSLKEDRNEVFLLKNKCKKFWAWMLLIMLSLSACSEPAFEGEKIENTSVSGAETVSDNSDTDTQISSLQEGQEMADWEIATDLTEAELITTEGIVVTPIQMEQKEIPDTEAIAFVQDMGIGWCLGNTFDAYTEGEVNGAGLECETMWCGAYTSEEVIEAVQAAGFRTIRIPVTWRNHVSGADFTIAENWLARVQEVVDIAYNNGMYVILNIHHDIDEDYYYPTTECMADSAHYMQCIWQQLAERFKNYDNRLIFESVNEPRLRGTQFEWNMVNGNLTCDDAVCRINELNQVFVDTVRASGGNNANRYLMIPGYCTSLDGVMHDLFRLPEDTTENRLIVTVHAYTPYNFALQAQPEGITDYTEVQRQEIDALMEPLYERFVSQGIPVIMGEFGARDKDNLQDRVDYTSYYVAAATANGVMCCWWDNNAFTGDGENFGLLDRNQMCWTHGDIVNAMMLQISLNNDN